jgi:hypothetical protein
VLLACALVPAAPAAAQEDLWEQFPLDPSPTPETRTATPTPAGETRPAPTREGRSVAATPDDGDDGGSGTAWIVAAVLGAAGIGLTIAGLSIARREPQAPEPPRPAPAPRGPASSAAAPPRRARAASAPRAPAPEAEAPPAPAPPRRERPAPAAAKSRPRPASAASSPALAPSADWEECQVALAAGEGDEHHFHAARADAGDPVARSPSFRARGASAVMESADAREALQVLVTTLLEGGWQLVGRDGDPWALRFRRRVRSAVAPPVRHPAGR